MKDRQFLIWIAERLVLIHEENHNNDYISKLLSIAWSLEEDRETPNVSHWDLKKQYEAFSTENM